MIHDGVSDRRLVSRTVFDPEMKVVSSMRTAYTPAELIGIIGKARPPRGVTLLPNTVTQYPDSGVWVTAETANTLGSYGPMNHPNGAVGPKYTPHTYREPPPAPAKPKRVPIPGVGPDAPTTVNAAGGKQSKAFYRLDLLPPLAALSVAAVLDHGATKYGEDNWRNISTKEHVNHVLTHLYAWLAGNTEDAHLSHAACRMLMALEIGVVDAGTIAV